MISIELAKGLVTFDDGWIIVKGDNLVKDGIIEIAKIHELLKVGQDPKPSRISNSRFTLNPSKYEVHLNAFRKLLGSSAMDDVV